MAAEAKRLYKPFSVSDVAEEFRQPTTIYVSAFPNAPSRNQSKISYASPIDRIVLKSKANEEAIVQPETFEAEPVEFSNLLGGKLTSTNGTATFPADAFKSLPSGDVDIVLITSAGERRCKIGLKDQTKLGLR